MAGIGGPLRRLFGRRTAGTAGGRELSEQPRPQFLVVGVQKGGTTSLYHHLAEHPRVRLGRVKEYHFFDEHFGRGLEWYRGQLPALEPGEITGDFTPLYIFHPHALERIAQYLPEARLIVLLRDPVDRAYSHYHHEVRLGREARSFEAAIAEEPEMVEREWARMIDDPDYFSPELQRHSYLTRGHYDEQLARLFGLFPREQVLVVQSERLFSAPHRALEGVWRFLELEPLEVSAFPVANDHHYPPLPEARRRQLQAHFRDHNRRLFELVGHPFDWSGDGP